MRSSFTINNSYEVKTIISSVFFHYIQFSSRKQVLHDMKIRSSYQRSSVQLSDSLFKKKVQSGFFLTKSYLKMFSGHFFFQNKAIYPECLFCVRTYAFTNFKEELKQYVLTTKKTFCLD